MLNTLRNIFFGRQGGDRKRPSLDNMLESLDNHLDQFATLVKPLPESMPRTPFDTDLPTEKLSVSNFSLPQMAKVMPQAGPLMLNMRRSANLYDGKFKPTQSTASTIFIQQLEDIGYSMGAKDIKYVKVPRSAIFKGKGIPHQYAVVFTVEMDEEPINSAPSFDCMHEVMRGYKNLALISNKMARFMRKHGFAAYPGTALGGLTDYPYLAELAGLGAIGYHGLLISPTEGARLRINTIYTNITNLPIQTENEHLWVRDFCDKCRKCIRKCPVNAIFDEPKPRGDGGMQTIDHESCRDYFAQNFGCAVCLAVCPFSQVGYDKVQNRFKGNEEAPQYRINPIY